MEGTATQGFRGFLILASVMAMSLAGCDYWPPALLTQMEQLRIHVQDLSDERAELEAQLRQSILTQEELQGQMEDLARQNQELRHALARAEYRSSQQAKKLAKGAKSPPPRKAVPQRARKQSGRVLAMKRPPMQGQDVNEVQRALQQVGLLARVDGVYGPGTKNAVKKFQRRHRLRADGVVGPSTVKALERQAAKARTPKVVALQRPPVTGPQVKKIQKALRHAGMPVRVDGTFGAQTHKAVKRFQRAQGLRADGVVGPATREALGLS